MAFDFELRFSGLLIFTFPASEPKRCRVLMVRTGRAMRHHPALAYEPEFLASDRAEGWKHSLYLPPNAPVFARTTFENEVLCLSAKHSERAKNLGNARFEVVQDKPLGFDQYVPRLSDIEPSIVEPTPTDPGASLLKDAFAEPHKSKSIVARLEIPVGTLKVEEVSGDRFEFRAPSGKSAGPISSQFLATNVLLTIKNTTRVSIESSARKEPLVFGLADTGGKVRASLSNEPAIYSRAMRDRLPHFGMFYRTVKWKGSVPAPIDRRIPFVASGGEHTIGDDFCPQVRV